MTQPARPDPARTPSRNDHVRPGPAPSGAVRRAPRAVGILALHIGTLPPRQPGRLAELPLAGTARRHVRRLASSATWPLRPRGLVPGWAVVSAGLSPVVVTAGWLVADAVQPAAYNPIRKTVSVMAGYAGTDRWIMTGALLLAGGCQLLTAAGLAGVRVRARILLGRRGPVQHRHRRISRTRSRLDSAARRLDCAWRGRNRGVACLRRPARATAAADPGQLRLCRRDCRVPGPARLARHRNPGWQGPGPG